MRRATFRRRARCGAARALFSLYGFPSGEEIPAGAVTRQLDAGDARQGHWLRADPVHLSAGTNLVLTAHGDLGLSDGEREALAKSLSDCASAHGLDFSAPTAGRWYLRGDAQFRVRTTPPDELLQRDVIHAEPRGDDEAFWRRLLSEMQILLHHHPVNESRRREGRVPVNSVWPWGAGALPTLDPSPFRAVHGDSALARALQALSGEAARPEHELAVQHGESSWTAMSGALEGASRVRVLAPQDGWEAFWRPWHRLRVWRRRDVPERWLGASGRGERP